MLWRGYLICNLVLVTCLGFGAAAFAATTPTVVAPAFSDIAGRPAGFALTVLGALGVYSGDSRLGGRSTKRSRVTPRRSAPRLHDAATIPTA